MDMTLQRTVVGLRRVLEGWRAAGDTIALVPTMGALHDGHLALVSAARERASRVVASLFVNPRQFGPAEDFDRYPRNEAGDMARFLESGVDIVYAPSLNEIYPEDFATTVSLAGPARGLEADHREGFFEGVATVVLKLLIQTGADMVMFGEKDYQQLLVVTRLVRNLDLPVTIIPVATVREADGLAMSSRNAYLAPDERRRAAKLHEVLEETASALETGASPAAVLSDGLKSLDSVFDAVDYLELRDPLTLDPMESLNRRGRLLAATQLGTIRLIDNVAVDFPG